MGAFASWLQGFVQTFLAYLYNLGIDGLQSVSDSLADFILVIIGLFPVGDSLPSMVSTPTGLTFDVFLKCLNWLAPVSYLVQLVTWSVAGMLLYVAIAPLARWAKALD